MTSSRLTTLALALALTAGVVSPASAQLALGDQRVGTSSASFLRIGIGARAAGLGESFVAVANEPSAIYWNPAGLASLLRKEVAVSHNDWPGAVNYEHVTAVLPGRKIGGSPAFHLRVLSPRIIRP